MLSSKEKTFRRERILQFIRENKQATPPEVQTKDEKSSRQKKRVTFNHGSQRLSLGDALKVNENERLIGQGLTSCLITKSSDTRMPAGGESYYTSSGENDPAVRNVGKLPRTDSECHFNAPGFNFLKTRHSEFATQEVRLNPAEPIRKELKHKCDFFPKYMDNRPFKDQTTQTLYRESSAQTLAYLPEISNKENAETLELFSLAKILPGEKPPGLHEVEILERARRRWLFNEAIKTNSKRLIKAARSVALKPELQDLLEAFEWEQWIEREEFIQECQMMRLQIVIKMFDKREKEMHAASKIRIEQACEGIEKRRQAGLHKNEIEFQRGMRRLDAKLSNRLLKWKKQGPMQALGSPCSEFYGPVIRHGVDPARRNYETITGRRAFDLRIDDLEKRVSMKNVQCPFSKLKEWSKPKEYVREYEQNFCNDDNLQRLYESLKTLRTQADVKAHPQCRRKRIQLNRWGSSSSEIYDHRKYSRYSRYSEMTAPKYVHRPPRPKRATLTAVKSSSRGHEDLENLIRTYEGTYIGSLMQFLADEMDRFKEQRKLHFFSIVAQRERWRREASEAGMRQKENVMRLLYEEIFQHSYSGLQDTSQQFVDTVLTKDIYEVMANEAADTVTEMARQIDNDISKWLESFKEVQNPLTFVPLRMMLLKMVFPDMEAAVKTHENHLIAQYIVEDVIFGTVWKKLEPFDVVSTMTSDLIDRLIDNDLYLFSSESEFDSDSSVGSWHEAEAIIRKLIRQAVPGRRWMEETERIVTETYNGLFDDIFDEILVNIEHPPAVNPSDLIVVSPSTAMFRVCHHKPKIRTTVSQDSIPDNKFLGAQLLSLVKKFKEDKVTKVLETDEVNVDSGNSDILDTLIKSQTLLKTGIRMNQPDTDICSITSVVDILEHSENLKSLKGSSQNSPPKPVESVTEIQYEEAVNEESSESTNMVEQETEENILVAKKSPNSLGEESSGGEEIYIYAKHESTIFSFR
ncbi:hypothetical protein KR059_009282 [Drosophila kikkawai]|nr:hypothetical protein KR059_009282 [Drosophila kikkawai]